MRLQLRPLLLLLSRRVNATSAIKKPLLILNGVKVLRGGNGDAMQALLFLSFLLLTKSLVFLLDQFRALVEPEAWAVAITCTRTSFIVASGRRARGRRRGEPAAASPSN